MKNKRSCVLKLNKKFYDRRIIEETKKEFIKLCECGIKESKEYFLIAIRPRKSGFGVLHFEFANYALALMK